MSDHRPMETKNNEPDNPDCKAIYTVALITIIFLAISIFGVKCLHDYFEDNLVKEYEKDKKASTQQHIKEEKRFLNEVDKTFDNATK